VADLELPAALVDQVAAGATGLSESDAVAAALERDLARTEQIEALVELAIRRSRAVEGQRASLVALGRQHLVELVGLLWLQPVVLSLGEAQAAHREGLTLAAYAERKVARLQRERN
jgi:hypothetical protein